jgi:hypothetical protein
MAKRSAAIMAKAYAVVDRLLAQGVSVEQTARKAGVSVQSVNKRRRANIPHAITSLAASPDGSVTVPHAITQSWGEALDAAWEVRRRAGNRERYRVLLRKFAASFAELADPMDLREGIRAVSSTGCRCQPSDIRRAPCPGHGKVAA